MNIVDAIVHLVNNPVTQIVEYYSGSNRANNAGDALEEYIKDLFADTFEMTEGERVEKLSEVFSYLGNKSNPPDAMIRNGDAIEVKKIETETAALALNSSYPKHKLKKSSTMLSQACKSAEVWTEKDIIYAVGVVKNNNLKRLCMVYGLDYCASEDCYERIRSTIKTGVESIPGVDFTETRELGHVNKVDPLGITYLRVRGMWGIENPWKVFSYIYEKPDDKQFDFMCVIEQNKWNSFNNTDQLSLLQENDDRININAVRIKDPDNPALLHDAKLITFSF